MNGYFFSLQKVSRGRFFELILFLLFLKKIPAGLNSVVHVLMYSHYLSATLEAGDLWWKRYLTRFQLTQFVIIFIQSSFGVYYSCGWPDALNLIQLVYMVSMVVLFSNFYNKSYIRKKENKDE